MIAVFPEPRMHLVERLHACIAQLRSHRGHLVVCGGGHDPAGQIRPAFVALAGGPAARIAVVPVASSLEATRGGYTKLFRSMGAREVWIVDPDEEQVNHPAVEDALRDATGICITGGDQKLLARSLADSLTLRTMVSRLRGGTAVYTTSAGTAALSDYMVAGLDHDDRVRVLPGLNILPGLTFETHLDTRARHQRLSDVAARKINALTIGIDENTALLFLPGTCQARVLGTGEVIVLGDGVEPRFLRSGTLLDLALWA